MPILDWMNKKQALTAADKTPYKVLVENKDLSYGDQSLGNMIIKGDNLEALKALLPYYKGQVKCIYIDPPYNTGKAFDHYDDNLEHSIWLSLMYPRLELLRDLLSEDGSIFVQIDDNEQSYLKLIMDEIFGRKNFVVCLPTIMNLKGNQDQFGFAGCHEYILSYAKDINNLTINNFIIEETENDDWKEDDFGLYKKGAPLRATGEEALREDRPYMFYPILLKDNKLSTISKEEFEKLYSKSMNKFNDEFLEQLKEFYIKKGFEVILPRVSDKIYGRWRWGYNENNINRLSYDVLITKNKGHFSLYKKQRPEIGDLPTRKPKSFLYKPEYSSGNGTSQIKKIFGNKSFDYPKPEELISDIIYLASNANDLVLDSFLGSGTTCAVAQKMNRRYIGIEMGEHAVTHCVPRMKKVIEGTDEVGISKNVNWKGGGGYTFYDLGNSIFDTEGNINNNIKFKDLAFHVWFSETKTPLEKYNHSPLIGIFKDTAYYLLYNGILGDKSISGGNVLTSKLLAKLPKYNGKKIIYGEVCRLSAEKLLKENIIFKQTPYDIKAR